MTDQATDQAITKPGKHGALHLYILRYTDKHDECCPIFESRVWRYNVEHAIDAFDDSNDEGWVLLTVERAREDGLRHRAVRHTVESVRGLS